MSAKKLPTILKLTALTDSLKIENQLDERKTVLLLEPNYKNKYPPMGLMKLATYYREHCGYDVRFYKGDLKTFGALLLCEEFISDVGDKSLGRSTDKFVEYIKTKKPSILTELITEHSDIDVNMLDRFNLRYKHKAFPKFDIVCVTTLFTFYWGQTIDTINFAKILCKTTDGVKVGGIAASLVAEHITAETEIVPIVGLLDRPDEYFDKDGNSVIIDHLPLDYSILEEIDYVYPSNDAYFAYMTRGCVNKCPFCAVPKLEPKYCGYVPLAEQIRDAENRFGAKKDLLLMDNNVFASESFDVIIDEIKDCGFAKCATYIPENEYAIAFRNLDYNPRGYIRKMVGLYNAISSKLAIVDSDECGKFYSARENAGLLCAETATIEMIREFDEIARPLYEKCFKRISRTRYIDFNQGVDARFVTAEKMKKLAEINIRPLRIAFDKISMKSRYKRAVELAGKNEIRSLSNYLLYNYKDKPEDLYERLSLNVKLCESLGVTIYSFPMKYHPIDDPDYFRARNYIGKHWNKKFIRAIQAVLNSTKGKIGKGETFFEDAFGRNLDEFMKILWMPETFIIYRQRFDAVYRDELKQRLGEKYKPCDSDRDDANEWWRLFCDLSPKQREVVETFVAQNQFWGDVKYPPGKKVNKVLDFYRIKREDV